ncbi:MAG TPA: hypothetical protein VL307_00975 [Chitinophagaceae bacterium]|nr:hypothetical protein [Chitinophagaceae bacterium]
MQHKNEWHLLCDSDGQYPGLHKKEWELLCESDGQYPGLHRKDLR